MCLERALAESAPVRYAPYPARLLTKRRVVDLGTRTPGDSGPGGAVASEPRGKMALK
jgi:hypothetical protein